MTQSALAQSELFKGLVDIYQPESVSWFPQTIGWQMLLVIALVMLSLFCYRKARHYWHNRYRREALAALNEINIQNEIKPSAQRLFFIVKTVAVYLDRQTASMTGVLFLQHLDAQLVESDASLNTELGIKWLAELNQPTDQLSAEELTQLIKIAKVWVQEHKAAEVHHV